MVPHTIPKQGGAFDSWHQYQKRKVDYSEVPNVTSWLILVLEGIPKVSDIGIGFHSLTQGYMFVYQFWKVILTILFQSSTPKLIWVWRALEKLLDKF